MSARGYQTMKRDQHGPKSKGDNITWQDVWVLQRQMQSHLGMRVDILIASDWVEGGYDYTRVAVRAFIWEEPWVKPRHQVSALWEKRQVSTMTGLVVRLLHQLDHVAWHQAQLEDAPQAGDLRNGA